MHKVVNSDFNCPAPVHIMLYHTIVYYLQKLSQMQKKYLENQINLIISLLNHI